MDLFGESVSCPHCRGRKTMRMRVWKNCIIQRASSANAKRGGQTRHEHRTQTRTSNSPTIQQSTISLGIQWLTSDRKLLNFDWASPVCVKRALANLALFPLWSGLPRHAIEARTSFSVVELAPDRFLCRANELISIARCFLRSVFLAISSIFRALLLLRSLFLSRWSARVCQQRVSVKTYPKHTQTHIVCSTNEYSLHFGWKFYATTKAKKRLCDVDLVFTWNSFESRFIHSVCAFSILLCWANLLKQRRAETSGERGTHALAILHILCVFIALETTAIYRSIMSPFSQCARHLNIHTVSSHLLIIRQFEWEARALHWFIIHYLWRRNANRNSVLET